MYQFPSIAQFSNVVKNVKQTAFYKGKDAEGNPILDFSQPLPTLLYRGSVKLHGTNGGIVYDTATREISFQSRERVLSFEHDNAGFMLVMSNLQDELAVICEQYIEAEHYRPTQLILFGEWCGSGIQKGVAINELPKMFVIFAVRALTDHDDNRWFPLNPAFVNESHRIFCIAQFPQFEVAIDFAYPELIQSKLVEITEGIEAICPVGQYFGVTGIGEGAVWRPEGTEWDNPGFWFKVKGEKHSASKVRTLASVNPEMVASMKEFVDNVVTEARLEQGAQWLVTEALLPVEMPSTGAFLRWVIGDIVKEEIDTIISNGFDVKKLNPLIAMKARVWFMQQANAIK